MRAWGLPSQLAGLVTLARGGWVRVSHLPQQGSSKFLMLWYEGCNGCTDGMCHILLQRSRVFAAWLSDMIVIELGLLDMHNRELCDRLLPDIKSACLLEEATAIRTIKGRTFPVGGSRAYLSRKRQLVIAMARTLCSWLSALVRQCSVRACKSIGTVKDTCLYG